VVLAVVLVGSNHEHLFIILNVLFTVQVLLLSLPQGQQLGQLQAQQLNPLWSRVMDLVLMLDLMDAVTTTKAVGFSVPVDRPVSAISYATILTIVVKI
jgi:hypothetical protein